MNQRGFSLVELLVVIALIGILTGIVTYGFSQYSLKSAITNQTRQLYGDLMEYRLKAFYEKKNWTFKISPNGYGIYSSQVTSVTPVSSVVFKRVVELNNTTDVIYDGQGLANVSGKTICVVNPNDATVDSIIISNTRVQIGKKREGTSCDTDHVVAK